MKRRSVHELTIGELMERYIDIGLAQDKALFYDQISRYNRLFDLMIEVQEELKSRSGDQRSALLTLIQHPNVQVRLNAARATLAVAPQAARQALQAIADSREYPQAGHAGMTLSSLEEGAFKPV